ncbi:MAG: 30S ribosomal protein S7 [Leptonema sp. (in: Bacteria)]|nr:30S ribosomal protein S7 [Leptonema sp. (in: bacteria)]
MSRRTTSIKKRALQPDAVYNDTTVSAFVNYMMNDGKKTVAEKIFYDAMEIIQKKTGDEGIEVMRSAMENVKPGLEVKARRVGGVTYQVPVEVTPERRQTLAIRWLVRYARERKGRSMAEKLAAEFMDAKNDTGGSIKKREDTRKMAEANRAFSHYRW